MTLKELLAQIKAGIDALAVQKAGGQDVTAQLTELEAQKAQVEALIAERGEDASATPAAGPTKETPEQELERLRREAREREEREAANQIVQRALGAIGQEEQARRERIDSLVAESLQKQLGGQGVNDIAIRALSGQHGASRFATEKATDAQIAAFAAGQGLPVANPTSIAAGENLEAKKIRESKNIAHFMGIIAKAKDGGFQLSDGEREFLKESQAKALAEGTNSAGGYLVHPEWMPDILGLLRANAVVRSTNPRIVPFSKEMNQTSISSGATAYYTAENAHIQKSEPVLAEAPLLTPKNLTGLVPVSNYLLGDAPEADGMVRSDLVEVMALREDLAFLQGTGGGGEPLGLKNIVGRTTNPIAPGTDGFFMSLPQFRALKNITRTFNSQNPRWVLFAPPQWLNHVEGLTDADGRFLADSAILRVNDDQRSGSLDGVPFYLTTQIPVNLTTGANSDTTYLILVDANELIIGENQSLELAVSTEASYTPDGGTTWISAFQATQTLFRTTLRHDIAHRRPNHVIVQTGVRV
jgi:HK97 family phage major capsid protein